MPTFPGLLRAPALNAIAAQGVHRQWAAAALRKWEAGATADPCAEELKGKPRWTESSGSHPCQCRGCVERRCFAFFTETIKHFPGAPT